MARGGAAYGAEIVDCKYGLPTTYEVAVRLPTGHRTVSRRYRDFERLREDFLLETRGQASSSSSLGRGRLADLVDERLPPMPPKAVSSMLLPSFRCERKDALASLLQAAIASCPELDSDALSSFLGASSEDRLALRTGGHHVAASSTIHTASSEQGAGQPTQESHADDQRANTEPIDGGDGLEAIRSLRRQRWRREQAAVVDAQMQQPTPSAASSGLQHPRSATAPPARSAQLPAAIGVQPQRMAGAVDGGPLLDKVQLLPLQVLSGAANDDRLRLVQQHLAQLRDAGRIVERGLVVRSADGLRFGVVRCEPPCGRLSASTVFFTDGPPLPRLKRVQYIALKQRDPRDTNEALVREHVEPHLRFTFADESRCGVVAAGDVDNFGGVNFMVARLDPGDQGWGVVDEETQVFARVDEVGEFSRVHAVAFSDTLPSAYQYDIFADYVKPFFESRPSERFVVGQNCVYNGVMFKVVAAEPTGPCRVGASTEIFTDGLLHPTAQDLLTPEQTRLLAVFPPGLQMLLLQTDLFGDGEVAERLSAAENLRARAARQAGVAATIANTTQQATWSEEMRENLSLEDQDHCIVCLSRFETGEEVRVLPCRHVFHVNCIDEWLGRDTHCPLCRTGLHGRRNRWAWSR